MTARVAALRIAVRRRDLRTWGAVAKVAGYASESAARTAARKHGLGRPVGLVNDRQANAARRKLLRSLMSQPMVRTWAQLAVLLEMRSGSAVIMLAQREGLTKRRVASTGRLVVERGGMTAEQVAVMVLARAKRFPAHEAAAMARRA